MGFLDRLVADMIGDATGLPVKGLVRKVGAKNLLLLGGVAAAGGVAAHQLSQRRDRQPHQETSTPPPPPAPTQVPPPTTDAPLPPLPPVPSTGAKQPPLPSLPDASEQTPTEADLPPDLVFAIVRTMVGAALADGNMGPEEKQAIHDRLGESGLCQDRIRQINQDLVIPPSPDELAAMVSDPTQRPVLYRSAVLVTLADHSLQPQERAWLDRLASALGFDTARSAALERDLLG